MTDYPHCGSPKLLHIYMRVDEIKKRLLEITEEEAALKIEKAELEEAIDHEHRFLDRIDFGY